uniref:Suckerin-6 n=1 Tax=Acanthosepion esculentum TaxID=31210 RepID=A0A081DUA6_ACAES
MAAGHFIVSALLAVIALSNCANGVLPGVAGGYGTSYGTFSHGSFHPSGWWGSGLSGFGHGHTVSQVSHGPVGYGWGYGNLGGYGGYGLGGISGHYGGYGLGGISGHYGGYGLGGLYGHYGGYGLGGLHGHFGGYGLGGGYGGYGLPGMYGAYGGYGHGGVYSHYGIGGRTINQVTRRLHPLGYGIPYPVGHAVHRVTQPIAHYGTISRRFAIPQYEVRYVSYPVTHRYIQMVTVSKPYVVPRYEMHVRQYQVPVPRYYVTMAQYPVVIPRVHIAESHQPVTHISHVSRDYHQPIIGMHYPMGQTIESVSHHEPFVYGATHTYGGGY